MREVTREYYEERLLRVQVYIQKNLDSKLTLDELATIACFSPFHFHRLFRAMVGESLQAYIRRLRIERAAWKMVNTGQDILPASLEAGYESPEAFTRAFRKRFGMPPGEYRKQLAQSTTDFAYNPDGKFTIILAKQEGRTMNVEVKEYDPLHVAYVRHTGPYEQCQSAWEKLCSDQEIIKLAQSGATALGVAYDDPETTDADKLRYDACTTIPEGFKPAEGISTQTVEGGKFATAIHEGPYENMIETYKYLYGQWLPDSGYKARHNPCVEVYLNCPQQTPPEELKTEVRIPIE